MTDHPADFRIIFDKIAEINEQTPQEIIEIKLDEFNEYDEIRVLREIVMDVQIKPLVYFAST